jgi:DNA-binding response OmpR family regulator
VIAIVSPHAEERAHLAALCASRQLNSAVCASLLELKELLRRIRPRVILTRHHLGVGHAEDVIAALNHAGPPAPTHIVVLLDADVPAPIEARHIAVGADLVQRDPIQPEVLVEYLEKYHHASRRFRLSSHRGAPLPKPVPFAGGLMYFNEHRLQFGAQTIRLSPREVTLIELLLQARGAMVTYDTLYSEILSRRFYGDTSNLRVLLGKLVRSAHRIGLPLRPWIEVIPKTGYHYRPQP